MPRHVLFVIDVQQGLVPHVLQSRVVLREIRVAIAIARSRDMPILFFKYIETEKDRLRFGPPWTPSGSPASEVCSELLVHPEDRLYEKTEYSAFSASRLDADLLDLNVTTIWLCGAMAQVCVLATSIDAYARGYAVHVICEATGATSESNRQLGLKWMEKYTATVKSLQNFAKETLPRL